MNQANPLAQLRDIHLPDPISAWPPAPGWWLLALLLLIALAAVIRMAYRQYRRTVFRKQALQELQQLEALQRDNPVAYLQQLNQLLKRIALLCHPGSQTAALSGKHWLAFLDQSGNTDQFSQGAGQALMNGPYQGSNSAASSDSDLPRLSDLARQWIKRQQRPC